MSGRAIDSWQPDISVIVPVYNSAGLIGGCISSILETGYPADRLEVVVVDNASTDDTPRILQRYGARIRVVREMKRGPAAARNAGLRVAGGEVAAFTDSDCLVERGWLARLVGPLEDTRVGAAGGRIRALPDGNAIEHFGERIHDHAKAILYFRPAYLITMNLACRLELLRSLGLFDERLLRCEDVDLSYRIEQAGYTFTYVPDATVYHHNRSTILELMAEGYAHGYHAMKLGRLHQEYQRRMAGTRDTQPPPCAHTAFTRELPWRQEKLYWLLFDGAKRVGKAMGYFRASKLYDET